MSKVRNSFLILISVLGLNACRSGDVRTPPPAPGLPKPVIVPVTSAGGVSIGAQQLTSVGDNSEARFSPDGARIIFVSRNRNAHKLGQIYEIGLTTMKERRLTFQDGDATGPFFSPDAAQFYYSSSTDEIKEEPAAIARLMREYYPAGTKKNAIKPETQSLANEVSELYLQNFSDGDLTRLTRSQGFDGEADQDVTTKRIVFTSTRSGTPQIYSLLGGDTRRLLPGKESGRTPRYSRDGKAIVFARTDASGTQSQIMLLEADKTKNLTTGKFQDIQPFWHPSGNEILFSSNRGGKSFNLYTIDRAGACLKRLTTVEFDQLNPAFSPDGKRLVFTGRLEDRSQIYVMDYQAPTSCL